MVKRNGRGRFRKQRWLCLSCHHSFSWSTGRNRYQRGFVWFRRWLQEGYSIRQLAELSGHSQSTIRRIVKYWLERPPKRRFSSTESRYAIFDGTFLHRRRGMYAVMDGATHQIIYGAYDINEGPRDLMKFCLTLKEQGFHPKSVTIDGNPHIFRVVQSLWPTLLVQRCLVHVQRQGLRWCRHNHKRTDARKLRRILLRVCTIKSHVQRQQFERLFEHWNEHHGQLLSSTSNRGWVTSDLQRARSMLIKALPYMFSYLDDDNIPRSTNAIEGYFARLKQRYRQHRGLSKQARSNYFHWYFHLCPR